MLEEILILAPPDRPVEDLAVAMRTAASPDAAVVSVETPAELLRRFGDNAPCQLALVHTQGRVGESALSLIAELRRRAPTSPIVAFSDQGDLESASEAIAAGANDFLIRGPQLELRAQLLLSKLHGLFEALHRASVENERSTSLLAAQRARYRMVGHSPPMQAVIQRIERLAGIPRPVLIVGERGVGKELVARALHDAGEPLDRPFVTVNCAAFTDTLLESELFGHERGAFTGADQARRGKFEQADGGTLFLDEIGNMSLPFQQKILRVVEYGAYHRIGGHEERRTTVRVISATNVDLAKQIKEGKFLSDLYDRLAFEIIEVPPLRQRQGDVVQLAQHFLEEFAAEIPAFRGKQLAKSALKTLQRYRFPGNVRELKNIIERAAYRDITNEITPEDIGLLAEETMAEGRGTYQERVDAFSRRLIEEAMDACNHVQVQAAQYLGLTYDQFRYYRRKYGKET